MKINNKISFLVLLVLSIVAVFTFADVKKSDNNVIAATKVYSEDNLIITVNQANPTFIIKLKSNPTTGYVWTLKPYNKNIVNNDKHEFLPAETKLIGAGGFEQWSFQVKPKAFVLQQHVKLKFVYARPWEKTETENVLEFEVSFVK